MTAKCSSTRWIVLGAVAVAFGCISEDSGILDATEGCDDFETGAIIGHNLEVHPSVRRYMQAAADLAKAGGDLADDVLGACSAIALDLGATDTWSQRNSVQDAISNSTGAGACDAALDRVDAALAEAGRIDALGGCIGELASPECISELSSPDCELDADCDPTYFDVMLDTADAPSLEPVVRSLEAHLPALVDAGERKDVLALDAVKRLHSAGRDILDDLDDLDGKSLGCVQVASQSILSTVAIFDVSVSVSASVALTTVDESH